MRKASICKIIILVSFLLFNHPSELFAKGQKPLVWDMEELKELKDFPNSQKSLSIIREADKYYEEKPVVVTDKQHTFAPNKHYYCSLSVYWWPDPDNPGKYFNKDGKRNPEYKEYDFERLSDLSKRCVCFSKAYYITRDSKYYRAFVRQIIAWFIDENTYMYPQYEYSQVIPGYNSNKGRSSGMIDAYTFNSIIESIRLVNSVKRIRRSTMRSLNKWFLSFAQWSEMTYGEIMLNGVQNISLAYDVTLMNIYLFTGEKRNAEEIANNFSERRINVQIKEDGSQPEELKRTMAISYSLYNLTHVLDFCYLARIIDDNYYFKNSERIDKAFNYVQYYIENPDLFPFQQIASWEGCRNTLNEQLQRRDKLRLNIDL